MRAWGFAALVMMAFVSGCPSDPGDTSCSPSCGTGTTCCNSHCATTLVDRNNCGGCGVACASNEMCALGHCIAAVDAGLPHDGGHDAAQSGNCSPQCASGYRCCGTTCVSSVGVATGDARSDPSFMNCQTCGMACDPIGTSRCGLAHGTTTGTPHCYCGDSPACDTSTGFMCLANTGSTSGFSCINMATDPMHCGTPVVACASGEICMAGACTCGPAGMRCPTGQTCNSTSGCIDIMTDPMNCGAIGTACHVGESCTGGMCGCGAPGVRCMAGGLAGCGEECCGSACIQVDDYNCGGCGVQCPAPQVCVHPPFGGTAHCGTEGVFVVACTADFDAPPSDTGVPDGGSDADVDANLPDADTDAGVDAATDANVDVGVDTGT